MRSTTIILISLSFTPISFDGIGAVDSLMHKVIAIERAIMEEDNDHAKALLLKKKSQLYKEQGFYSEALATLHRIPEHLMKDSLADVLYYEKALNLFMLRRYPEALQEIWNIPHFSGPEQKLLYWMCLLENEKWNDFKEEYLMQAKDTADVSAFTRDFQYPSFRDPEKFEKLSRIPGLGLLKAGYTAKGVTSILFQAFTAGLGIYHYVYGYYFIGTFSGLLPARRFYNGAKTLAHSLILRANYENIEAMKETGYRYIRKRYGK